MLVRRFISTHVACRAPQKTASLPRPAPDLSLLESDPDAVVKNLSERRMVLFRGQANADVVHAAGAQLSELKVLRRELDGLRQERNRQSRGPGKKGPGGKQAGAKPSPLTPPTLTPPSLQSAIPPPFSANSEPSLKSRLQHTQSRVSDLEARVHSVALLLPNTSSPDAPVGDESAARVVKSIGTPAPTDRRRDHLALGTALGWLDFAASARMAGASWPLLAGDGALLELALIQYALAGARARGFAPVLTPDVVRADVAHRCGFQPRDEASQIYYLAGNELCLVGTAEIPLVAMSAATTFPVAALPRRNTALGRAFRAEAGAGGAAARGLYRVHQFSKVEMVSVVAPDASEAELSRLLATQLELLSPLGLPLRVLDMPTAELGASAHRKFDIEAWMPGRALWGELSSASNCTTYQARRLGIRCRGPGGSEYAHTLNATAAAIPRLIVAILENGAVLNEAGQVQKVRLPGVLRRHWLGDVDDVAIEWVGEGEMLNSGVNGA